MKLLVLTLAFCVIAAFLSTVAVGIGFLLSVCIPSLQLGHGIIAGAIITAAALYFLSQLISAVNDFQDDEEGLTDEPPVLVLPNDFLQRSTRRSKPKGKKK